MATGPVKKAEVNKTEELPPEVVSEAAAAVDVTEPELDDFGKLMKASTDRRHNLIRERVVPRAENLMQSRDAAPTDEAVPHHDLGPLEPNPDEIDKLVAGIGRGEALHAYAEREPDMNMNIGHVPEHGQEYDENMQVVNSKPAYGSRAHTHLQDKKFIDKYQRHTVRYEIVYPVIGGVVVGVLIIVGSAFAAPVAAAIGAGAAAVGTFVWFRSKFTRAWDRFYGHEE